MEDPVVPEDKLLGIHCPDAVLRKISHDVVRHGDSFRLSDDHTLGAALMDGRVTDR